MSDLPDGANVRIVAWNAALNLGKAWQQLEELKPTLLVVSECRHSDIAGFDQSRVVWMSGGDRGIALIGAKGLRLSPGPLTTARLFATASVALADAKIHLVGVCAYKDISYSQSTQSAIKQLTEWARQGPCLWAGDFNQSHKFKRPTGHNFSDTKLALGKLGLVSAYHKVTCEEHGSESKSTFFQYRNRDKGHHIDYVFAPPSAIKGIKLGRYKDWTASGFSDHVPVCADLEI